MERQFDVMGLFSESVDVSKHIENVHYYHPVHPETQGHSALLYF